MRYFLIAMKAWSHSIFQSVCLAFFRVVKNGFNRSVKREMNRPRAADECLKHSSYTRVGSSFSHLFHSNSIVLVDKSLILCLV